MSPPVIHARGDTAGEWIIYRFGKGRASCGLPPSGATLDRLGVLHSRSGSRLSTTVGVVIASRCNHWPTAGGLGSLLSSSQYVSGGSPGAHDYIAGARLECHGAWQCESDAAKFARLEKRPWSGRVGSARGGAGPHGGVSTQSKDRFAEFRPFWGRRCDFERNFNDQAVCRKCGLMRLGGG